MYRTGDSPDGAVLVVADAFSPMLSELASTDEHDEDGPVSSTSFLYQNILPWEEGSFGVIVGNPPWDEPPREKRPKPKSGPNVISCRLETEAPLSYLCGEHFLLLSPGGTAALLVAATAFHNVRSKSREFRQRWLDSVKSGFSSQLFCCPMGFLYERGSAILSSHFPTFIWRGPASPRSPTPVSNGSAIQSAGRHAFHGVCLYGETLGQ